MMRAFAPDSTGWTMPLDIAAAPPRPSSSWFNSIAPVS